MLLQASSSFFPPQEKRYKENKYSGENNSNIAHMYFTVPFLLILFDNFIIKFQQAQLQKQANTPTRFLQTSRIVLKLLGIICFFFFFKFFMQKSYCISLKNIFEIDANSQEENEREVINQRSVFI